MVIRCVVDILLPGHGRPLGVGFRVKWLKTLRFNAEGG